MTSRQQTIATVAIAAVILLLPELAHAQAGAGQGRRKACCNES